MGAPPPNPRSLTHPRPMPLTAKTVSKARRVRKGSQARREVRGQSARLFSWKLPMVKTARWGSKAFPVCKAPPDCKAPSALLVPLALLAPPSF